MHTFLKLLYSLLIGGAVVAFVGTGIYAFYPGPKAPEYPSSSSYGRYDDPAYRSAQDRYNSDFKAHKEAEKRHMRNIAPIAFAAAILATAVGWWLMSRNEVIGEGIALGGIFNSIYGLTVAGVADSRPWLFLNVTALLGCSIALGYRKFADKKEVKPPAPPAQPAV